MIFTSRITATARAQALTITPARSADALLALAAQGLPRAVIVDLAAPGLNVVELITRLRAACNPMPRVVAYGSHVDTATLRAARAAGCDFVFPRSKFVEELAAALPQWLATRD
jgi:DNA-binding NarL/FixJ family response regulator